MAGNQAASLMRRKVRRGGWRSAGGGQGVSELMTLLSVGAERAERQRMDAFKTVVLQQKPP